MKVIGNKNADTYLCEVGHSELEKFMDLYYGNLKKLQVGESISLAKGYNHASDIKIALEQTRKFIEANAKTIKAITSGLNIETIMNN